MRISDWSSDVCSSDLYPLERRQVALGEVVEIVDQPRHRRIVAVGFLCLKREAFGQRPGAVARGIEALYDDQHPLDVGERGTETLGQIQHGPEEIAGPVDLLDHLSGYHQVADRQGGARL